MLNSPRARWILLAILLVVLTLGGWNPWQVWRHNRAAQEALRNGDPDTAQSLLEASLKINPKSGFTNFLMARTARRQGRAADVARYIESARDAGYPARALNHELLLVLAQAGQMEQVEPRIPELLPRDGADGQEVTAAIVSGYAHRYEFQKAHTYLDAWQADYPDDPEPHVMRGKLLQRCYDAKGAEREFRAALKLRPQYRGVRELLALTLVEQNEYDAAASLLEDSLREAPGNDELRTAWGECLLKLGRVDEAAEVFQSLASSHPDDCDVLAGLGSLAFLRGDLAEALQKLERVRSLCPHRSDARYKLAQTLQQLGKDAEADQEFQFVRNAGKTVSQVHDLAESLIDNPENVEARLEIGKSLLQFGDRADAAMWLETIFQYDPDHREAHRLLADYYEQRGDRERAARHRSAGTQSAHPTP